MIFNPRVVHTLNNNLGNIISVPAPKEINVSDRPEVKKGGSNTVEIPADNNKTEITPVVIDNQNDSFNQKMIEETAKALQDAFDKDVEEKTKAILAGESIETVSKVEIKESKKSKTETVKATVKETKSVVEKKEKTEIKEVKEVKTSTKEEKSNKVALKKYNVIGGVFSIKDNANNYVKKSQADGYPAAIAGKNKRGYWVVSLASANSEAELEATLENIKATYEKNAWIYKK
jgi:cell division septation protein DedD